MNQLKNVLDCYHKTAEVYADTLADELNHKPLDRLLLTRFAEENRDRGLCIDLGCGPGQTTAFLQQQGRMQVIGTDLSPTMIEVARRRHGPTFRFETANFLHLPYPAATFGSALAFYAIVHLTLEEVELALNEVYRVLRPGGHFLFSFHVSDDMDQTTWTHLTTFFGQSVDINFSYFPVEVVLSLARKVGFERLEGLVRYPYEGYEYPSLRAYLLLVKPLLMTESN